MHLSRDDDLKVAEQLGVVARGAITRACRPAVSGAVLKGREDMTTSRWHTDLVVERLPDVEPVTLGGVGHMPNSEAPEAIVAAVESFASVGAADLSRK